MGTLITSMDALLACAVCFGDPGHAATYGMNMAIAFMVVVVGGVLGCVLTFMICLARRARLAAEGGDLAEMISSPEETEEEAIHFSTKE